MDYDKIERQKVADDIKKEVQRMDSDEEIERSDVEMEKNPKKVIKGKRKKRNLLERGADLLLGSSGVKSVLHSVAEDVIIPSVKDVLYESLSSGFERLIYRGDERPVSSRYSSSRTKVQDTRTNRTNYASTYKSSSTSYSSGRKYEKHKGIEPVIFASNREALDVLAELNDEIRQNGFVRVADFYNITGYDDIQHVDNYFGWENVNDCIIRHTRDGWVLYMSEPVSLDY